MKIKKIVKRLLQLHPKEIDLSLERIIRLNRELGNPQEKLKIISITGTNGKYSVTQTIRSILEEAGYACDLYTSPHIKDGSAALATETTGSTGTTARTLIVFSYYLPTHRASPTVITG